MPGNSEDQVLKSVVSHSEVRVCTGGEESGGRVGMGRQGIEGDIIKADEAKCLEVWAID